MLPFMSNRHQRNWREEETLEAAARRLLAEWDERIAKKKAEEALQSSSKIADQPARSLAKAEEAEGENVGLGTFDRSPPVAAIKGC